MIFFDSNKQKQKQNRKLLDFLGSKVVKTQKNRSGTRQEKVHRNDSTGKRNDTLASRLMSQFSFSEEMVQLWKDNMDLCVKARSLYEDSAVEFVRFLENPQDLEWSIDESLSPYYQNWRTSIEADNYVAFMRDAMENMVSIRVVDMEQCALSVYEDDEQFARYRQQDLLNPEHPFHYLTSDYFAQGFAMGRPQVQAGWMQSMQEFVQYVQQGAVRGWNNIGEYVAMNYPLFAEKFRQLIDNIKFACKAVYQGVSALMSKNFFVILGVVLVQATFNALELPLVGNVLTSIIVTHMMEGPYAKWASIIAWSTTVWSISRKMVGTNVSVNVSQQVGIPQVQSGYTHITPAVVVCSLLASLLLGLTSFGLDLSTYKTFATRMDNHFKVVKATRYLSETMGDVLSGVMNFMGMEYYGMDFEQGLEVPDDVASVISTLRTYTMEKKRAMMRRPDFCIEIEKMYCDYMKARLKYNTNRAIIGILDRLQAPIFNLYSRASAINPSIAKNRVEPVVIMLHGESGVGKSTLLYHLGAIVLSKMGKIQADMTDQQIQERIQSCIYARMIEQEFWDGYDDQECVLIDDAFQKKDTTSNPNDEFMEMIRMSNPFPYALHMAAMEKKDSTAFKSRVVVGTTNLRRLVPVSVVSVKAIERRIDMPYTVTIKQECADVDGRLRKDLQTGTIDTGVYEFQHWNTTTGEFDGPRISFDALTDILSSKMDQKEVKHEKQSEGIIKFARSTMERYPHVQGWQNWFQRGNEQFDEEERELDFVDDCSSDTPDDPNLFVFLDSRSKIFQAAIAVLAVVSLMLIGYSFSKSSTKTTIENLVESGKDRAPRAVKNRLESGRVRQVVLSKNRVEAQNKLQTARVDGKVEGWISENSADVAKIVKRNMRWIFIEDVTEPITVFFPGGRTFLMNIHYVNILDDALREGSDYCISVCNVGTRIGIETPWSKVEWCPYLRGGRASDLAICQLPTAGFSRLPSVMKHIASKEEMNNMVEKKVVMLVPHGNDKEWAWIEKNGVVDAVKQMQYQDLDGEILVGDTMHSNISSIKGDCGGVYVLDSATAVRKIVGFHYAGGQGSALAVPLVASDIVNMMDACACMDPSDLEMPDIVHKIVTDVPAVNGNVSLLGKINDAPYAATKTKIVATKVQNKIFQTQMAPATLFCVKGRDPMAKAVEKQFRHTPAADEEVLDKAMLSYRKKLATLKCDPDYIRVLTFNEAVRGVEGDDYMKGINRTRSAGYPWSNISSKGKTHWFGTHDWILDSKEALAVKQTVAEQIDRMIDGQSVPYLFLDTLKDETLPIEKVRLGKTRVFSAAPMDFIIVFRMYFLSFIAHMMKNRIYSESAVGIKSQSVEWDLLAKMLRQKSSSMIAGDFSAYDGTLHPALLWKILDIIEEYYQLHPGYVKSDTIVRRKIWENVVNSFHIMNGYVYQLNHSQPSGNPATAVLNSMYNSLSMRYVWELQKSGKEFNDYCDMIAYGDDNIISINKAVHSFFNQDTITAGYETIGMTYTDEEKTGTSLGFRTLDQVSFLKRGFIQSDVTGMWIAPLKKNSILECFNWIQKTDSEKGVMKQNAEMAFAELSLHSTEDFQHYVKLIRYWLTKTYGICPTPASRRDYHLWMRDASLIDRVPALNWA